MHKKIIKGLLAALLLSLGISTLPSCGAGGSAADFKDTATYAGLSDTLSVLLGRVSGYQLRQRLDSYRLVDTTYSLSQFSQGLAATLDHRHPLAYVNGVGMGLNMTGDIDSLQVAGFPVDREKILAVIESTVNADVEVSRERQNEIDATYAALLEHINATGDTSLADSLNNAYGRLVGTIISEDIRRFETAEQRDFDEEQFLAGLRSVFSELHTPEFNAGAYHSTTLSQSIAVIEKKGVNIRREDVLNEMQNILNAPELPSQTTINESYSAFDNIMEQVEKAWYDAEDARMAASDEALQNIKTGEALVEKARQSTTGTVTTETGLTYVIRRLGSGRNITPQDTVLVSYYGSHLDGKVFDSNPAAQMPVAALIPGFREGLTKLSKGAKATFWIPGDLAYKGHGAPSANIGPMETLVFDVEILDIL